MKVTHYFKWFLLLAAIAVLSACQQDDVLEPYGIKITFQAVTGFQNSADSLMLEEALIGIESIDFKREGEADSATVEKTVYNGPYVVDLLNATISPSIRWIFAEPGYYRKIDVTTYNALPRGKTISLKGTVVSADGSEDVPFELITSENYTLEISNSSGITIRKGENVDLLVVFNLSKLFNGIDLNNLEKNEQGVVVISDNEGTAKLASVINTFEAFSNFGLSEDFPFPEKNPGNESPDEDVGDENEEPIDDAGDEPDDGKGSGPTDGNGDGDSSGDDGDDDSGNSNDGNNDSGDGNIPPDDDEEDPENDEGADDESGDDDDKEGDKDDKNKDKGDKGKGNKGNSDRGKKK